MRDILNDREKLLDSCNEVVICLLDGLLQLDERNWVTRSMWPNDIYIIEDLGTVQYTNLMMMCEESTLDNFSNDAPNPYGMYNSIFRHDPPHARVFSDNFGVGIIMLEILVGTKIMLTRTDYLEIKTLLFHIKHFIDERTWKVIWHLLEFDKSVDVKDYIYNYLPTNENALWMSI